MQTDLDFLSLIVDATFVVQLVILILLLASVISWSFIFNKWRELKGMKTAADAFEARFWSGEKVSRLYEDLQQECDGAGMAAIFCEGFREYMRLREDSALSVEMISSTSVKAMKVALSREIDHMESQLNFLATVGSTAPYIGLFGTVWGIMDAFLALRNVQYATLSLVAPGIAEALIATAMGLFAAIPAVIAYNRFRDRVERLVSRFDNFLEEFTTLLSRQVLGAARTVEA
jgi:biopolymer transport protein TolQ